MERWNSLRRLWRWLLALVLLFVLGFAVGAVWVRLATSSTPGASTIPPAEDSFQVVTTLPVDSPGTTASTTTALSESTTTSSSPDPAQLLPERIVVGRTISVRHEEGFEAYRNAEGSVVAGPMTVTVEGHGEFSMPANTSLGQLCEELEIVLSNEQEQPLSPCFLRIDLDGEDRVVRVFVLSYESDPSGEYEHVFVVGRVLGAGETTVVIAEPRRGVPTVWPVVEGVDFECIPESWELPEFPTSPNSILYVLTIDLESAAVSSLDCRGSF